MHPSLFALVASLVSAEPAGPADPRKEILSSLTAQLTSAQKLKLNADQSPYFVSYQLKDFDQREISARYGAIFEDATGRQRQLAADVRVGSYAFDSSIGDDLDFSFSTKGTSYVSRKMAPLDDEANDALKTALWLITDEKYKAALFNFLKKRGDDVYTVEDPKKSASFTKEIGRTYFVPHTEMAFDHERFVKLARAASYKLASHEAFFDSEVRITADHIIRYFVNTEGAKILSEEMLFGIHAQAFTRAPDGQLLENSRDWYAPLQSQLPTDEQVFTGIEVLSKELIDLRLAPTIDPYTGPAILESDAAGVLFHEAVGHRLEGERQENDTEGKTFRGQVGKPVLPVFLSIVDDPTVRERGGVQLNGFYAFDDEGVAAQKTVLVDKGVLKTFLLSRKPVEGFTQSNGHGRAQGTRKPVARMANLILESTKTLSDAELKKQLIAEAKRQGKPYGLIIRDITGGNTNTTGFGYQAFKGTPRMVYRVDVRDGNESLVRGVEIVGTPLSSINRVMATGKKEGVFNGFCGAESGMVPVSTVAPAVLIQEIELQRSQEGKDRPPLGKSPLFH